MKCLEELNDAIPVLIVWCARNVMEFKIRVSGYPGYAMGLSQAGSHKRLFEVTFQGEIGKRFEKIYTFVRADTEAALQTDLHHDFRVVRTTQKQAEINRNYLDEILIEKILV